MQGFRIVIARPQRGRGALSAKREEVPLGCNLGKAVAISPMTSLLSGRVLRDCHVASLLAMTNLGALCGRQSRSITCQPARRSLSAATDAIGFRVFIDSLCESAALRRERHAAPLQRSVGSLANYQRSTFHFPFAARRVPLQSFIRLHIAELSRRAAGILAERVGEGR